LRFPAGCAHLASTNFGLFPAAYFARMKAPARPSHALADKMPAIEATVPLQQSLDNAYRRIRENAYLQWQRHFAHQFDPSDECVSVRIAAHSTKNLSLPGSAIFSTPPDQTPAATAMFT
jgi:hypothetical protein